MSNDIQDMASAMIKTCLILTAAAIVANHLAGYGVSDSILPETIGVACVMAGLTNPTLFSVAIIMARLVFVLC